MRAAARFVAPACEKSEWGQSQAQSQAGPAWATARLFFKTNTKEEKKEGKEKMLSLKILALNIDTQNRCTERAPG